MGRMSHHRFGLTILILVAWTCLFSSVQAKGKWDNKKPEWLESYGKGVKSAKAQKKLLLVCFDRPQDRKVRDRFDELLAQDESLASHLDEFVLVSATTKTEIKTSDTTQALIKFDAFRDMEGSPGISIIDYRNDEVEHYGHVVTVYPVNKRRSLNRLALESIFTLPAGTLTQRSLVLAVMMHHEQPKSVLAKWHPVLASEVESHSNHQARIANQGHHNWSSRFHRINSRIGNGLLAQEVCAESWPGQGLMDAAEECVQSWRQSSGHWSAVSGRQRLFAYDMKQGSNGTWYATGIFAR